MIGFFVNLFKLIRAVWHGVKFDEEFRVLVIILLTLVFGATYFYSCRRFKKIKLLSHSLL